MEDLRKVTAQDLTARINAIRMAAQANKTPYEKAKQLPQPLLAELNKRARDIALKYGMKPQKFAFIGFGRNLSK